MKKSEIWEGIILLLSALLLLPIWLVHAGKLQFPTGILKILSFLQVPVIIVLGVIFIRRLRRILRAMRDNKNRPGPFLF